MHPRNTIKDGLNAFGKLSSRWSIFTFHILHLLPDPLIPTLIFVSHRAQPPAAIPCSPCHCIAKNDNLPNVRHRSHPKIGWASLYWESPAKIKSNKWTNKSRVSIMLSANDWWLQYPVYRMVYTYVLVSRDTTSDIFHSIFFHVLTWNPYVTNGKIFLPVSYENLNPTKMRLLNRSSRILNL